MPADAEPEGQLFGSVLRDVAASGAVVEHQAVAVVFGILVEEHRNLGSLELSVDSGRDFEVLALVGHQADVSGQSGFVFHRLAFWRRDGQVERRGDNQRLRELPAHRADEYG